MLNVELRGNPHRTDNRDVIILLGTILCLIYVTKPMWLFFSGRDIYIAYIWFIIYVSNNCQWSHILISQLICFEPFKGLKFENGGTFYPPSVGLGEWLCLCECVSQLIFGFLYVLLFCFDARKYSLCITTVCLGMFWHLWTLLLHVY